MSAFMYAAQHGPRKVIRKFLGKKCFKNLDLTAGDLYGRSALYLAATCGQANVVLELLNRGAYVDVDEMTVWGSTPLTAVSSGSQREEILRYLLRAGADFEAKVRAFTMRRSTSVSSVAPCPFSRLAFVCCSCR